MGRGTSIERIPQSYCLWGIFLITRCQEEGSVCCAGNFTPGQVALQSIRKCDEQASDEVPLWSLPGFLPPVFCSCVPVLASLNDGL